MTDKSSIERTLGNLSKKKQEWFELSLEKKIIYIHSAMKKLTNFAELWVNECCKAKGIEINSQTAGQEWFLGPVIVMRQLRYIKTALKHNGRPILKKIYKRNNLQYAAEVLPIGLYENIIWRGFKTEILIEKNKEPTQGSFYINKSLWKPSLSLVLGAGNVSSISPLDALYKLFHEGKVCLVKLNPVNDYLLSVFQNVFADLIEDGYLAFIKGDGNIGSFLCESNFVDDIHITGSSYTHDKIIWGDILSSKEDIERKKENKPKINKNITSELGAVTPAIIVPGRWTQSEIKFQARQVVSAIENNASFNCNSIKILVTCKDWAQREEFLNCIRQEMKKMPPRKAYYPGAFGRYNSFLEHYPNSEIIGQKAENCVPWTLISNLTPQSDDYAFKNEAFCGILMELALDSKNIPDFMNTATEFCNEKLWGTLSCSLFINPSTEKQYKKELENMIETLRYGSIGVNCWGGLSYALGATTWGAFPGHTFQDIQSGIGTVHNGLMIDHPEKSVVRAPFRIYPTPPWFYKNKNLLQIAKSMFLYEYTQKPFEFFRLIQNALNG